MKVEIIDEKKEKGINLIPESDEDRAFLKAFFYMYEDTNGTLELSRWHGIVDEKHPFIVKTYEWW